MSAKTIRLHKLLVEKYLLQQMILEAQNYEGMFDALLKKIDDPLDKDRTPRVIKQYIEWSKKHLKKNDRIVWFLRWARYWLEYNILKLPKEDAIRELNKKLNTHYTVNDYMPIHLLQRDLEHFMSIDAPDIQKYVFDKQTPRELLNKLGDLEKKWQSSANDDAGAEEMYRENRLIEQDSTDDIIMKFPDGFAWVDLHTPVDNDEGNAMGHCGNRGSYNKDETILSLRKSVNYQHKKWWYPVCTFILDAEGRLGEMKGRNNDKPQSRYHPYIIALLKTPRIKAIKGGGYMPQNNFSLNDLSKAEQDSLVEVNPNLMTVTQMWKKFGITDQVKEKIEEWLDNNDILPTDSKWIGNYLVLEKFKNVEKLVDEYGNGAAKHVCDILTGHHIFQIYYATADSAIVRDMIRSLNPDDLKYVGEHLQKNYPDDADDIDNYDPTNVDDVIELFRNTDDDDVQRAADHAYIDGLTAGAEAEMSKAFHDAIDDNEFIVFVDAEGNPLEKSQWDTPCYIVINIKTLMDFVETEGEDAASEQIYSEGWKSTFEMQIDLSEPYYGWSGYDEKSANERFSELIHEYF